MRRRLESGWSLRLPVAAVAVGAAIAAATKVNTGPESLLFGSLFSVTGQDLVLGAGLALAAIFINIACYRSWLTATFFSARLASKPSEVLLCVLIAAAVVLCAHARCWSLGVAIRRRDVKMPPNGARKPKRALDHESGELRRRIGAVEFYKELRFRTPPPAGHRLT